MVPELVNDSYLQERARDIAEFTKIFVALRGNCEVGLLMVDVLPSKEMRIFEIQVLRQHRRNGVGSFLLEQAEELARDRGCTVINLNAQPIDCDLTREQLEAWYGRRGYLRAGAELRKRLEL